MDILQIIDVVSHFAVNVGRLALVALLVYGVMRGLAGLLQSVVQRRKVRAMRATFAVTGNAGKPIPPKADVRNRVRNRRVA